MKKSNKKQKTEEEGDIECECKDCGTKFPFTVSEQQFYKEKGFDNQPIRCQPCRRAKKDGASGGRGGRGGGRGGARGGAGGSGCFNCGKDGVSDTTQSTLCDSTVERIRQLHFVRTHFFDIFSLLVLFSLSF